MVAQPVRMPRRTRWRTSPANTVAVALVAGAALCAGLSLGTRLLGVEPFVTIFAVTSEQNFPTWYAVGLLLVTGLLMIGVGALTPRSELRLRWGWWAAALVLLALSIDELAALHERLGSYGAGLVDDATGLLHFAWVVPGLAIALVPIAALAYLGWRLPRAIAVELLAGLGVFLVASFGLEMLGGLVLDQVGDGHLYALTAATEELLEMVGVIAMLHATARMLVVERSGSRVTFSYPPTRLSDARLTRTVQPQSSTAGPTRHDRPSEIGKGRSMPEGHTLHRLARDQTARFAGAPVAVTSPQGRFAEQAALVDGRVLDVVTAHGKHLFAAFGDRVVHVHLGLFGKYGGGTGEPPPPRGALRMRWIGSDAWTDLRGPTACEVLTPSEVEVVVERLGPDPLARRPDGTAAYVRIARSRAPIAALLMDQAVLSGVGNVYRAELLFRHQVPPFLPGRDLGGLRWAAMWADLVTLMRAGLRSGRIVTTRPEDRDRIGGRARQADAHYVYRRTDLPCRICGTPVAMQLLAARKLYWCPVCQSG